LIEDCPAIGKAGEAAGEFGKNDVGKLTDQVLSLADELDLSPLSIPCLRMPD